MTRYELRIEYRDRAAATLVRRAMQRCVALTNDPISACEVRGNIGGRKTSFYVDLDKDCPPSHINNVVHGISGLRVSRFEFRLNSVQPLQTQEEIEVEEEGNTTLKSPVDYLLQYFSTLNVNTKPIFDEKENFKSP